MELQTVAALPHTSAASECRSPTEPSAAASGQSRQKCRCKSGKTASARDDPAQAARSFPCGLLCLVLPLLLLLPSLVPLLPAGVTAATTCSGAEKVAARIAQQQYTPVATKGFRWRRVEAPMTCSYLVVWPSARPSLLRGYDAKDLARTVEGPAVNLLGFHDLAASNQSDLAASHLNMVSLGSHTQLHSLHLLSSRLQRQHKEPERRSDRRSVAVTTACVVVLSVDTFCGDCIEMIPVKDSLSSCLTIVVIRCARACCARRSREQPVTSSQMAGRR